MLRGRGIDVRLATSVTDVSADSVTLSDGQTLPCRTLVWTAGVAANPLLGTLGLETGRAGRLVVSPQLQVPKRPEVFAAGDAAAVPDLAKPAGAITPPTAQHAQRQGVVLARNVIRSLRGEATQPYRHRDLGLVVDLGGTRSVARPLGSNLSGLPAQVSDPRLSPHRPALDASPGQGRDGLARAREPRRGLHPGGPAGRSTRHRRRPRGPGRVSHGRSHPRGRSGPTADAELIVTFGPESSNLSHVEPVQPPDERPRAITQTCIVHYADIVVMPIPGWPAQVAGGARTGDIGIIRGLRGTLGAGRRACSGPGRSLARWCGRGLAA